jgi:hypothetical protein
LPFKKHLTDGCEPGKRFLAGRAGEVLVNLGWQSIAFFVEIRHRCG